MINLSAWDVYPAGYVNKILMGGNLNEEKKSTQKVTGCTACSGYGSDGGGMWKLYFYDVLRACSGKRGFHGRSCFY